MASVFSPVYQVPDRLIAETKVLRKKTNSIRGAADLTRKLLIKEIDLVSPILYTLSGHL